MLGAAPIRDLLLGGDRNASALKRGLAEGAGVTIAATLATAPLVAADFGVASLTTLPANLLALPAVAPVMWLGMIVSALGQVPGLPVGPLNALAGALAGYVAQIAHWLGSPAWAQASVPELGASILVLVYAGIAGSCWLWLGFARRLMPFGKLPRRDTELVILRVAHLRGCDYEWHHHVRLGKRAGVGPGQRRRQGLLHRSGYRRLRIGWCAYREPNSRHT